MATATATSVTLSYVRLPWLRANGTAGEHVLDSIEAAHRHAAAFTYGITYAAPVVESTTYSVGQPVAVRAFPAAAIRLP